MAFLFVDSLPQNNSRLLHISVKALALLLLSAGLISTLVMLKGAVVPYSCEIVFSSIVGIWSSIRCLLSSSLSICFIIHVMVVLIAASSIFYRHENDNQDEEITVNVDDHDVQIAESPVLSPPPPPAPPPSPPRDVAEVTPPPSSPPRDVAEVTPSPSSPRNVSKVAAASPATPSSRPRISIRSTTSSTLHQGSNHDVSPHIWPNSTEQNRGEIANLSSPAALFFNEALMSEAREIKKTTYSLNSSPDSSEPTKEKIATTNLPPLPGKWKEVFMEKEDKVTSNLSDDKENEEEDTMEATWKAIIGGGKQRPKKKHLKKSETWDVPPRRSVAVQRLDSEELLPSTPKWKELRKAETFNDAVSITCRGGLRRDPSMSLEELNQQFEAFIKKFNDNMRLERQESNQRFLDMIHQGF